MKWKQIAINIDRGDLGEGRTPPSQGFDPLPTQKGPIYTNFEGGANLY